MVGIEITLCCFGRLGRENLNRGKTNNHHKGIYGLYLYYCYWLLACKVARKKKIRDYSEQKLQ